MNIQKTLRAIALSALFIIPLFALFPTPFWPLNFPDAMFFPFITGKAFYFRLLIEIALACWIVLAFLDARYRPRITPLTVGVTLFAVVALLADLLGVNVVRSLMSNFERMEGWLVIAHLWAFFMVSSGVFGSGEAGKRLWQRWFNTSLVVACVVIVYALCQQFGWTDIHQGSTRLDASLGNAAYLAVYLLMHLGIAAYSFFNLKRKLSYHIIAAVCAIVAIILFVVPLTSYAMAQAIVGLVLLAIAGFFSPYLTFALVSVFVIFESQTRGTMIGLLIGLAVACVCQALYANGTGYKKTLVALTYPLILALYALFVLALNSFSLSLWYLYWIGVAYLIGLIVYVAMNSAAVQNKSVRMGRWVSVSILALAFIGIGVFFLIKDAQFIKNSPSLDRIASISLTDTKTQARAYIWPMALKGFTQRPILGWGQENFNYIFNANYNPKMWSQEQWFDRAHSVYLDWLVASGGVGLIVYLSLYILIVLAVWKSSLSVTQKSVLTGLVAGYAIHNFFVFDNLASYVFFFALLGFAGSLSIPAIDSKKTSRVFSFDLVEYVVMPISIIALVAGVYFLNIRPIQANVRLIAALKSCTNQTQLPDPSLFTKALSVSAMANQEIREQVLSCAGGIIARGYPGTTKQAFYDLALQQIKAQTDSAPRDARMYVLGGMFLSNINQLAEALPILEKAHELTPNKQTASIQLATAYINMNRNEEALTLLKNAYEADPTFPDARSAYVLGLVLSNRDADARALASTTVSMFENERVARAYASIKQYDKSIAMFKKLLAADPKSVPLRVQLAEVYASANMKWMAVDLIRAIGKDYPEYKDQVEAAVKQIQDAPVK